MEKLEGDYVENVFGHKGLTVTCSKDSAFPLSKTESRGEFCADGCYHRTAVLRIILELQGGLNEIMQENLHNDWNTV